MLVCFWSLKGGAGCSVTAALTALAALRRDADGRTDGVGAGPGAHDRLVDDGRADIVAGRRVDDRTPAGRLWGPPSTGERRLPWSPLRGGAGASAPRSPRSVTLIDPDGELAAVLGATPAEGPGVADWLRAGAEAPPDALRAAARPVAGGLVLVGPGTGAMPDIAPTDRQLDALDGCDDLVVVDAGSVFRPDAVGALARSFAAHATRSVLVTRPCYLALRRAPTAPVVPSAIVVVDEPGRALGRREIEEVVGAPVAAWIAVDPAIARAVDAGLLATRIPRGLVRALEMVA